MNKKYILLLLIIPAILVSIWFRQGKMIAGAEEGIPLYNLDNTLNLYGTAWVPRYLGYPGSVYTPLLTFYYFLNFIERLNIPVFIGQAITFYIVMIVSGISVYTLSIILFDKYKNVRLISFISSLFYLLNPFTFISIWQRLITPFYFQLALLPSMLLFFILGVTKKEYGYILPFCLISFMFSGAFGIPTFVITTFSVIFFYFINYIWNNKKNIQNIKFAFIFFILTLFFWILTSSWWLILLLKQGSFSLSVFAGTTQNIQTLLAVSKNQNLTFTIRLINGTNLFMQKLWGNIYSTPIFQMISFIIPSIVLSTLYIYRKNKTIEFLLYLIIFSLFIVNGSNAPLGQIFMYFFDKIYFLQSFRNPFEKYGIVLSLAFSLVFGFGIICFSQYLKKRFNIFVAYFVGVFLSFFVLVVYAFPMWNGKVFGGNYTNFKIEVPKYYKELSNKIGGSEGRIIYLPFITGGATRLTWASSYLGTNPEEFLLPLETISETTFMPEQDKKIVSRLWDRLYTNDFWKMMHLTGSQYIVLHKDLDYKYSNYAPYDFVEKYLKTYQKPTSITDLSVSPCLTWERFTDEKTNLIWLRCNIIKEQYQNWEDYSFLHLLFTADFPGKVYFTALSTNTTSAYWGDLPENTFNYDLGDVGKKKEFILSLKAARNRYSNFDFSKVNSFYIYIKPTISIPKNLKIAVLENKLDRGVNKRVENISFVKQYGNLNLYELDNKFLLPKIFTPASVKKVKNIDEMLNDMDNNFISLNIQSYINEDLDIYKFNQPKMSYIKINPSVYKVSITDARGPFFLIFNESYNPFWKLNVGQNEIGKHVVVNGFANGYLINKNGNFEIELEFNPQKYLIKGRTISIVSFIFLLSITYFYKYTLGRKDKKI